ncbi:hypothetical protein ACRYCC_32455 [Actinomadura scrupuli]|uniref:hypothetical protein n=1 Tax=Actinomadura scrupuli TaxID=559629 RepID=UPI003D9694BE
MRELEREVAARLRAQGGGTGPPPPDLAARILHGAAVRRRRRRAAEAAAVTLAVALAIGLPAYVSADRRHPSPAGAAPSASRGPAQGLRPTSVPAGATEIPRRLPGGWLLSAYGVGPEGELLGVGVKYGTKGTEEEDGRLWRIAGGDAAPAPVADPDGLWTAASGDGVVVWPEHRDDRHDFQLMCGGGGGARQLGDRGVVSGPGGFQVDRDVLVWTDESRRTVWTAKGCAGSPRRIDTAGRAVAFSYPYAYVVDAAGPGRLRRIDVVTGAAVARTLPSAVTGDAAVLFAAGPRTLSYSDGRGLVVIDTATWRPRTVATRLPHSEGLNGERTSLTAGDEAVVYSTRPLDGDPETDGAVVYRTSGHTAPSTLAGEAYTKGRWLVWRDAGVYRRQLLAPP